MVISDIQIVYSAHQPNNNYINTDNYIHTGFNRKQNEQPLILGLT